MAGRFLAVNIFPALPSPLSPLHSPPPLCLFLLLAGCPRNESDLPKKPAARPLEGVKLRLAVADDPALASAIVGVRGEWNSQTGAELEVVETNEKDLAKADAIPADAVVCPLHLLAVLAERKMIAPVPSNILHNAEWTGIFELLKLREAAWAKQTMAVPFGSPVFCCYYRADLWKSSAVGRRKLGTNMKTWPSCCQSRRWLPKRSSPKRPLSLLERSNLKRPLSLLERSNLKRPLSLWERSNPKRPLSLWERSNPKRPLSLWERGKG